MLRTVNVLFVVGLVILLVVVFDPQARIEARNFWQEIRSVLEQLEVQISSVIQQITHQSSDLPAEEQQSPPPYDGPIYNIDY